MPLTHQLPEDFTSRLVDCIDWSREQLLTFQQKRMDILRQYVGRHYGHNGCKERVPNPFIRLQLSILSRHLVSSSPALLCETKNPGLRGAAYGMQEWANQALPAMGLAAVLKRWVMDALVFPIGLLKVCSGYAPDYSGQPDLVSWADVVDPERSVYDMGAAAWNQLDFIGHRYTAPIQSLVGPGFDEEAVAKLQPQVYQWTTDAGAERSESLAQTDAPWMPRLRDYIDCWEIFLPKEQLAVTFAVVGNTINPTPIRVEEYLGDRKSVV